MAKFRKKPIVIEAVCWDGTEPVRGELNRWVSGNVLCWSSDDAPCLKTLEGTMRAEIGDWIIKGVKGEFYPCKPDIFAATYEPVNESTQADYHAGIGR